MRAGPSIFKNSDFSEYLSGTIGCELGLDRALGRLDLDPPINIRLTLGRLRSLYPIIFKIISTGWSRWLLFGVTRRSFRLCHGAPRRNKESP